MTNLNSLQPVNKQKTKKKVVDQVQNNMPLGTNVSKNIKELYKDNSKSGKARGNNGKPRSRNQILAIAMAAAKRQGLK